MPLSYQKGEDSKEIDDPKWVIHATINCDRNEAIAPCPLSASVVRNLLE
jgi:hypothetical protein